MITLKNYITITTQIIRSLAIHLYYSKPISLLNNTCYVITI